MRIAASANLLFSVLLFAAPSFAHAAEATGCGENCIRVEVVEARRTRTPLRIALTGDIQAKFQNNVAFRINGRIATRLVNIGDHVTRNTVLARLDPRDQKAAVDTAAAILASAKASLAQAQFGFDRQQALIRQGFTTRPAFDQALQTLRTQQAAAASAEAAFATAREQFGYADLVAGVSGFIVARSGEIGQVVQAGTTVFTIAQDGGRDAVFDVYEGLLADAPAGGVVDVVLSSDLSVHASGHVREVAPSVDAGSGTVKIKVALDTMPPRMTLGSSVIGSAAFAGNAAITLPAGALFYWDSQPAVWLVDGAAKVTPRIVRIDRFEAESFSVGGGLEVGSHVVVAGIQFLHPGQSVEVVKIEAGKVEVGKGEAGKGEAGKEAGKGGAAS